MNGTSTSATCESTWSYDVKKVRDINASILIDLVFIGLALLMWLSVIITKRKIKRNDPNSFIDKNIQNVMQGITNATKDSCQPFPSESFAASSSVKIGAAEIGMSGYKPVAIITRATAAAFLGILTVTIVLVSKIINGSEGVTSFAIGCVFIIILSWLFYDYALKAGSRYGNTYNYAIISFCIFLQILAVLFFILGYTHTLSSSCSGKKKTYIAAFSLSSASVMIRTVYALFKINSNVEDSKLEVISQNYYTSFNTVDTMFIGFPLFAFIIHQGLNVAFVDTRSYAIPFIYAYIPLAYGLMVNVIYASSTKASSLPYVFNALLMLMVAVCVTMSLMHVCAFEGIIRSDDSRIGSMRMCASGGKLEHTAFNNIMMCSAFIITVGFMFVGVISSPFAPSGLLSGSCRKFEKGKYSVVRPFKNAVADD